MCGQNSCCSNEGCSCGCSCGMHHRHHHGHHEHGMGAGGMGMEMESPVSLMDVDEEIKMLEEYRDALNAHLAKVNKRLEGLKR